MRLLLLIAVIAALGATCAGFANADPAVDFHQDFGFASSNTPPAPFSTDLLPMFESAGAKYDVPVPLLLSLAYFGSGFENRGASPTVEGGYGVTALRLKNYMGCDTLTLGAQLTGYPVETVKLEPAANIMACAAVMDYYAKMWQIDRTKGLEAWVQPVTEFAGLGPDNSKLFAWEVFKSLKTGFDNVNAAGETIHASAQDIGSIDLPGLIPQSLAVQAPLNVDYPGASWTAAASCNYDASVHASDTVVIHTMEGSLAGTINWFQNCDHGTMGPSSCTYNIGKDGTIVQMVREYQTAWDVGCYNGRSVGIEHEGSASDTTHPTAMYNASAALTRDICDRWGILKQKKTVGPGIVGHIDVTNCCCGTHTDPGVYWDWTYYMNQVNANPAYDVVYVEPRGQNSSCYSEDTSGLWGNSTSSCNSFDTHLALNGSRYFPSATTTPTSNNWMQVRPNLGVPGGTYRVWMAHYGSSGISSDSVFNISLTNCTAQNGDIKNGQTIAFRANPSCQFSDLGTIQLPSGQTQPTVKFTYSSGNVNDTNHRWNIQAFRFTLVPTTGNLTLVPSSGGTVSGGGAFTSGTTVTVTATPNAGYRFLGWATGGFTGTVVSANASYSLMMPAQSFVLYASFEQIGTVVTTVSCPPGAGSMTGAGGYTNGQNVTVTATALTGYTFSKWTSGSCGGTLLTSSPSYTFTLAGDTTVYANFTTNVHTLAIAANPSSKGSVAGDTGSRAYATSCTVVATPNPGEFFAGWSSDPDGFNMVSESKTYTFPMPDYDLTLYANYSLQRGTRMFEGFETRAIGDLDMNDVGGPNASDNGNRSGSPWIGNDPTDISALAAVGGINPHSGTEMAGVESGAFNSICAYNLSYRFNSSNPYSGGIYMDWWFYDPKGVASDSQVYQDYLAITSFSSNPILGIVANNNHDWDGTLNPFPAPAQELAIGAAQNQAAGYSQGVYQYRVAGDTTGYNGGWHNTSVARTVGWHHARIIVGPAQANKTNDVAFYIDSMTASVAVKNSTTTVGYNSMLMKMKPQNMTTGYVDDITFGTTPGVLSLSVSPTLVDGSGVMGFTFQGVGAASFELRLDNGSWVPATSPWTVDASGLSYGTHTVTVRPIDASGNDGLPVSATFTVDRSSIRSWAVIGFYPWGSSTSDPAPGKFSNDFLAPESSETTAQAKVGATCNGKAWFSYTSPLPVVDFDAAYGSNKTYGASYVFTYVVNTGATIPSARLACGSDDGIKVFFNGVPVWSNDVYRGLGVDGDLTNSFPILSGVNRLLIKTTQGAVQESVQARFCDADKADPGWLSQLSLVPTDETAPTGTVMINSGAGYVSSTSVTLILSSRDDLSGVAMMSFSNDNVTWSTPQTFGTVKMWQLIPGNGPKTVYVKFTDKAGNTSAPITASVLYGPRSTVMTKISDLWPMPNDSLTPYAIYAKVVTAATTGAFWIEETDRYSGIRVNYPGPVVVHTGDSVDVTGYLSTGTQRNIAAVSVTNDGPAAAFITPLGTIARSLVGSGFNADTPGLPGAKGLYNVGLLVKVAGSVTGYDTTDPQKKCFWIDDGSGLSDGLGHTGLKVFCGSTYPLTSGRAIVTGVDDIELTNGSNQPVLFATQILAQ